ncbi:FAD/NAD(P)-binding protein [Fructobacillus sp. M2-14]|uniref:FAD/NAD(P)-binding protein n=1 Tax=Fructobacillus broussonetiae TaxID=2713173 RepID=A0ABS5R3H8_9LACO|nr:FAD/NAD(P)-binding protein [Fructobacillus broussonetiae]MBS9338712.1 FAD/NAD(P)-binding protein [Fructobacillus broussonetiae]
MKIALIGAGPRNLAILGRLIFLADKTTYLDIDMYDRSPIGGRVWDPFLENNHTFLMNTAPNQVTLFDDFEMDDQELQIERPNLLSWAQTIAFDYLKDHPEYPSIYQDEVLSLVSSNDFASRGLFGIYAAWFFELLQSVSSSNININFYEDYVVDMEKGKKRFAIRTESGAERKYDRVVFAPGHIDNKPNEKQQNLINFANDKGLQYFPASHPAENNFENIDENNQVLIEGLGLSFFDVILSLTAGKGGVFITETDGSLTYHSSGHEPRIVAGSFNGLPPRAKGINQKEASQLYQPRFFTLENLKAKANLNMGHLPYDVFMKTLKMELTYKSLYNQIIQADFPIGTLRSKVAKFIEDPDNWPKINDTFDLNFDVEIDWDSKVFPAMNQTDASTYKEFVIQHIQSDIRSAELGNDWSPLTGAYDILRDVRDIVRTLYNDGYFTDSDYQLMLTSFKQFDNQLSAGPPLIRMRQLLALIEAGVIQIAGPGFKTGHNEQLFTASDSLHQHFEADVLIEARLSTIDFRIAKSSLVQSLVKKGLITSNDRLVNTNGDLVLAHTVKVDLDTLTVVDKDNHPVKGFFVSGIPLEGSRWFNTVIPRPYVHTLLFQESKLLVNELLSRKHKK